MGNPTNLLNSSTRCGLVVIRIIVRFCFDYNINTVRDDLMCQR